MKLKTTPYNGRLPSWSLFVTLYSFFLDGVNDPTTGSHPRGTLAAIAITPPELREERKTLHIYSVPKIFVKKKKTQVTFFFKINFIREMKLAF